MICLLAAGAVILYNHRSTKRTMERLDKMVSDAINDTFCESAFDESLLSALEARFARYLSASALSAKNLSNEKDRISTLVSDISHQTKTPIANLLLYTELLEEETLSAEAHNCADILHTQAEKLRFLIDALVKLSRLENGIITLHPAKEAVAPMLEQVRHQFASKAQEKGLALHIEPTEISACFDRRWTCEALCNLVDNAIKYTDRGSVTLRAVAYEMFVRIDVEDTGAGIAENEQAQIFSRFYRSESSARQDGVGIGLYLAREILRSEGGYIKVQSSPGKGSVFSMFLMA